MKSQLSFSAKKYIVVGFFAALLLSACSSKKVEPEVKELPSAKNKSSLAEGSSEDALFNNGKRLYGSGLYSVAKDNFETITTSYPLGAYGEFAEIKIADAEFQAGDYVAAAAAYEQFVTSQPSSPNTPYAMLRAGQSYKLATRGSGRDISPLEKALTILDRLLATHPETPFAGAARKVRAEVLEEITVHEKLVADFYAKQNKPKALAARRSILEQKWEPMLQIAQAQAQAPTPPPCPTSSRGAPPSSHEFSCRAAAHTSSH